MLLSILFIYLWLFAKRILKRIYQRICKNKTRGANVVQNVKIEENNPCISIEIIILVQFQATFALTLRKLVQFCTFILALVCVGINHQKGGDWKGIRLTPIFPNLFWWLNCPTQIIGLTSLPKYIDYTGVKRFTLSQ